MQSPQYQAGPRVQELERLIQLYQEEAIELPELENFLNEQWQIFEQREETLNRIHIPEQALGDLTQELQAGYQGITLWKEGLQLIYDALLEKKSDLFEQGQANCRQGDQHLQQAIAYNLATQEAIQKAEQDHGGELLS